MEQSKIEECGEKLARQKSRETRTQLPTWTAETNLKTKGAVSSKTAEYHGGPADERWRAFEKNNNALNSDREILEKRRQGQCPAEKKRGCSNSEQEITRYNSTDDGGAEEPERKKAKKVAVDANLTIAETVKDTCQRMATNTRNTQKRSRSGQKKQAVDSTNKR